MNKVVLINARKNDSLAVFARKYALDLFHTDENVTMIDASPIGPDAEAIFWPGWPRFIAAKHTAVSDEVLDEVSMLPGGNTLGIVFLCDRPSDLLDEMNESGVSSKSLSTIRAARHATYTSDGTDPFGSVLLAAVFQNGAEVPSEVEAADRLLQSNDVDFSNDTGLSLLDTAIFVPRGFGLGSSSGNAFQAGIRATIDLAGSIGKNVSVRGLLKELREPLILKVSTVGPTRPDWFRHTLSHVLHDELSRQDSRQEVLNSTDYPRLKKSCSDIVNKLDRVFPGRTLERFKSTVPELLTGAPWFGHNQLAEQVDAASATYLAALTDEAEAEIASLRRDTRFAHDEFEAGDRQIKSEIEEIAAPKANLVSAYSTLIEQEIEPQIEEERKKLIARSESIRKQLASHMNSRRSSFDLQVSEANRKLAERAIDLIGPTDALHDYIEDLKDCLAKARQIPPFWTIFGAVILGLVVAYLPFVIFQWGFGEQNPPVTLANVFLLTNTGSLVIPVMCAIFVVLAAAIPVISHWKRRNEYKNSAERLASASRRLRNVFWEIAQGAVNYRRETRAIAALDHLTEHVSDFKNSERVKGFRETFTNNLKLGAKIPTDLDDPPDELVDRIRDTILEKKFPTWIASALEALERPDPVVQQIIARDGLTSNDISIESRYALEEGRAEISKPVVGLGL